jgi:hypothetical protein
LGDDRVDSMDPVHRPLLLFPSRVMERPCPARLPLPNAAPSCGMVDSRHQIKFSWPRRPNLARTEVNLTGVRPISLVELKLGGGRVGGGCGCSRGRRADPWPLRSLPMRSPRRVWRAHDLRTPLPTRAVRRPLTGYRTCDGVRQLSI